MSPKFAERNVTGGVSKGVVEVLEPVEIEEHQRECPTALRGRELVLEEEAAMTAVRQLGEQVGERHVLDNGSLLVERLGHPSDTE